jgi:hypothetical protein
LNIWLLLVVAVAAELLQVVGARVVILLRQGFLRLLVLH